MFIWWFVLAIIYSVLHGRYCVIQHSCCNTNKTVIISNNGCICIVIICCVWCVFAVKCQIQRAECDWRCWHYTAHVHVWRQQAASSPDLRQVCLQFVVSYVCRLFRYEWSFVCLWWCFSWHDVYGLWVCTGQKIPAQPSQDRPSQGWIQEFWKGGPSKGVKPRTERRRGSGGLPQKILKN